MMNVKQKIAWLWQNIDKILIILLFLTFTFNIRKVILTPYSYLNGGFNEYMTPSFSWADVLIAATIFIYTIKYIISQYFLRQTHIYLLRNKYNILSIFNISSVSRETILFILFIGWAGLFIFLVLLQLGANYRFITLLEVILFAAIAAKALNSTNWLKTAKWALIFNGLIQSIIGIAQFIINKSIGLYFLGESIISPNVDGVPTILINSEKHIRAYGTLPHPNILAAFLLVPLFLAIGDIVKYYSNVPRETVGKKVSPRVLFAIFVVLLLGLLCAGSRSALLGLIIGMGILWMGCIRTFGTAWNNLNCFSSKRCVAGVLFLLIISPIFIFYVSQHSSFFSNQSLGERRTYQIVSYETISHHIIKGVGLGQYIFNEYKLYPKMESWRYQPVHNAYLLVFSELRSAGFVLIGLLTIQFVFRGWEKLTSQKLTESIFYVIIISFLPLLFLDHLFWDLKIGLFIFSFPFLFMLAEKKHHQSYV